MIAQAAKSGRHTTSPLGRWLWISPILPCAAAPGARASSPSCNSWWTAYYWLLLLQGKIENRLLHQGPSPTQGKGMGECCMNVPFQHKEVEDITLKSHSSTRQGKGMMLHHGPSPTQGKEMKGCCIKAPFQHKQRWKGHYTNVPFQHKGRREKDATSRSHSQIQQSRGYYITIPFQHKEKEKERCDIEVPFQHKERKGKGVTSRSHSITRKGNDIQVPFQHKAKEKERCYIKDPVQHKERKWKDVASRPHSSTNKEGMILH